MDEQAWKRILGAKRSFAHLYLDGERGVYSVGIGKEGGELVISVRGTKAALAELPQTYLGFSVRKSIGAPGIVANYRG